MQRVRACLSLGRLSPACPQTGTQGQMSQSRVKLSTQAFFVSSFVSHDLFVVFQRPDVLCDPTLTGSPREPGRLQLSPKFLYLSSWVSPQHLRSPSSGPLLWIFESHVDTNFASWTVLWEEAKPSLETVSMEMRHKKSHGELESRERGDAHSQSLGNRTE